MGVVGLTVKRQGLQHEARLANMESYLEWLLTPQSERSPSSKAKFAEWLGVTSQTLRNYARDPWLQGELLRRGRALNRVERAVDVVDSLFGLATNVSGKVPAATQVSAGRTFLEWTERTVADTSQVELGDLSFDELRAVIDDLERKVLA